MKQCNSETVEQWNSETVEEWTLFEALLLDAHQRITQKTSHRPLTTSHFFIVTNKIPLQYTISSDF